MVIAITGGIASGKSLVCKYLSQKGVPIFDSDRDAKDLYIKDKDVVREIENALDLKLVKNGEIDFNLLSKEIFLNPAKLETLEVIVHPKIKQRFLAWCKNQKRDWCGYCGNKPFVCIESAIILNKKIFDDCYDIAVYVDSPKDLRIKRAMLRDGKTKEEITQRMYNQSFDMEKVDYIIENIGDLQHLYENVDTIFNMIINKGY